MKKLFISTTTTILGITIFLSGIYQFFLIQTPPFTITYIIEIILSSIICIIGLIITLSNFFKSQTSSKSTWSSIQVSSQYKGPLINSKIDEEFAHNLFTFYKEGNGTSLLNRRDVYRILEEAMNVLKSRKGLVKVNVPHGEKITVVGDIHGQFFDLATLFEENGFPSETNRYIFNGDLVDRGRFSVEVVLTLFSYMIAYPDSVFINKGNHETLDLTSVYGFMYEVEIKYDPETFAQFIKTLRWLPYASVVNSSVFIVHGGIPNGDYNISDIEMVDRGCDPVDYSIEAELLWNDPQNVNGSRLSFRGMGHLIGPDIWIEFMKRNDLELIIRSHEMKKEGYEWNVEKKVMTLFSAPNYCGQINNKASYVHLSFDENDERIPIVENKIFDAVETPQLNIVKEENVPVPEVKTSIVLMKIVLWVAVALFVFSALVMMRNGKN